MSAYNERMVIRGGRVISSGARGANKNTILINDGSIEDIIPAIAVPHQVNVCDFPGHVISPYLCDYYLHFPALERNSFARVAERLLAHGIGKACECGDAAGTGLKAKKELCGNRDVVSAGQGLYKTCAYGKYRGRGVTGIEDARRAIEALISGGVDYIKIVHSGIYDPQADRITEGGFERSELREMIAYAQDNGLRVFCHANGAAAVREAVEEGASAVIHGLHVSDDTLSEMHDKKVLFIPALQAFRSIGRLPISSAAKNNLERATDGHLAAVSRAYEKGVTVLPGSDAGPQAIPYGASFFDELRLMVKAGVPYDEVMHMASASPLERSQRADLPILEGLTIRHVIRQGKFLFSEPTRTC